MNLITPEEIRLIPLRYSIGKRPLSLLLGWGELTYTRLLDGNTPTAEHAAQLRAIIDDPALYARTLVKGRSRITDMAFRRSFQAVDELLADESGAENAMNIFLVADRICALAEGDLTPSALQRLAYYAQGFSFSRLKRPLFDDLPTADAFGPEYERIRNAYSFDAIQEAAASYGPLDTSRKKPSSDEEALSYVKPLTKDECAIIDKVYSRYGNRSGQELSRMSKYDAPWRKARKKANVGRDGEYAELITEKSLRKFFAKAKL